MSHLIINIFTGLGMVFTFITAMILLCAIIYGLKNWWNNRDNLISRYSDQIVSLQGTIAKFRDDLETTYKFKTFVHKSLDEHGVPHDPFPDETKKHGCRISGRLKWLYERDSYRQNTVSRAIQLLTNSLTETKKITSLELCISSMRSDIHEVRAVLEGSVQDEKKERHPSHGEFTCPKCKCHMYSTINPGEKPEDWIRECGSQWGTELGCMFRWPSTDDHLYFK